MVPIRPIRLIGLISLISPIGPITPRLPSEVLAQEGAQSRGPLFHLITPIFPFGSNGGK